MPVIEHAIPLFETIGRYRFDPLGYVTFAFPWGKPGTPWPATAAPSRGSATSWRSLALAALGMTPFALHYREKSIVTLRSFA